MPVTRAPQVRVIYAECNSPAAGTQSAPGYLYDTWYDLAQNDITSTKTAVLAAMGLSYATGTAKFTALTPMTVTLTAQYNVVASPGGVDTLYLTVPDYVMPPTLPVPASNTLGHQVLQRTLGLATGDTFFLESACANGGDTPITYAALSIVRLV